MTPARILGWSLAAIAVGAALVVTVIAAMWVYGLAEMVMR